MAAFKVCAQKGVKKSGIRDSMASGPGDDETEGIRQWKKDILRKWGRDRMAFRRDGVKQGA